MLELTKSKIKGSKFILKEKEESVYYLEIYRYNEECTFLIYGIHDSKVIYYTKSSFYNLVEWKEHMCEVWNFSLGKHFRFITAIEKY